MSLEDLRRRIDEVDKQLVKLLNERARFVIEIGKLKNKTDKPIYSPDREKEVFAKIVKANYNSNIITKENDLTNVIMNGYRDPALNIEVFTTGGESHVDFIMIDEQLFLEVQVSVTPEV